MTDFLTAAKSVRTRQEGGNDALLTAVGSRNLRESAKTKGPPQDEFTHHEQPATDGTASTDPIKIASRSQDVAHTKPSGLAETPAEALQVLRSQPSFSDLVVTLEQINLGRFATPFSLDVPGPLQAQVISTILSEVIPTFWPALKPEYSGVLLSTLKNVAGLNATVARLRFLASQKASAESISDLLDIADQLFSTYTLIFSVWFGPWRIAHNSKKREMSWKELVSVLGSGKVIAAVAQAEDAVKLASPSSRLPPSWVADGTKYCTWLGRSIAAMMHCPLTQELEARIEGASLLLAKGLHIGHSGQLLQGLFRPLESDLAEPDGNARIMSLIQTLPAHAKRTFMEHLLRLMSSTFLPDTTSQNSSKSGQDISAVAGLLSAISQGDERMAQHIQTHLKDPALSGSLSYPVRRACLAVLASQAEDDALEQVLEKLISTFSSSLFIAHAPVAQQESLAHSILLAAGYVHRNAPMSLLMTARSSGHMSGVSNRLDSSNARARWLGMVVGTNLSKLVDKPGSQMEFGTDEMKSEDAMWYADLVKVKDTVGTFLDFQALLQSQEQLHRAQNVARETQKSKLERKSNMINGKPVFGPPRPPRPAQTKIVGERVTEILDNDEHDEDDLKPYAKPDSDPEDSDEDATLVNRNKSRAPVYIRDLMAGLRDDKNYDKFNLSIKTAASLIRRKAGFGKEVTDHAEELAGMLSGLQDPFDTDDFDDMRLQALVAVLLSDVKVIAPLLARQAFAEGYSISQRCVLLSALGLGGRELAGFKIEDDEYNPKLSNTEFPSKKLPPRLHAIYSPSTSSSSPNNNQTNRLEAATKSLEHQMIQPLALRAADQSTAHLNALKIRTFSSRMDVEAARTKRKPPANELAKCFGQYFFFPLANRYEQEISAYGSGSVFASAPFVLVTFLKTLALLLHASGPATLGLPQICSEMWDLLLSLRVHAINDISILQAVLFALLTLLEINTDKQRIAQEHPKQLMETQQWVDLVFERMGSSGLVDDEGKSEEAKVRTLAAGVLMKVSEIVESYQRLLVGYEFG